MGRFAHWGWLGGATMLLSSAAAYAADPAAKAAQARFEEGLLRVKAGDLEAARISFAEAYAVLRRPNILWNLALCEEKTNHLLDALTHFRAVAHDAAVPESERADAQHHAEALRSRTGHIDVVAPAGVALALDGGGVVATTPLTAPLDVEAGRHLIEARFGDAAKTAVVDAPAGETAHVQFAPPDATGAAASGVGAASGAAAAGGLSSSAAASGGPAGRAGPGPSAASGGSASGGPSPSASGGHDASPSDSDVSGAKEGANAAGVLTPSEPTSTARIITVAAVGGAAAVAVGLGAYFGVQSHSDGTTADAFRNKSGFSGCAAPVDPANSNACLQLSDAVHSQNRETTLSNGFYVAGGILAVGAAATWFMWPAFARPNASSAWVFPSVGDRTLGMTAGGRF